MALRITAVAETHIHADFVSGGREFAQDPNVHLYLSFPYTRLKTRLGELPKNRRLFIHCGTGKRASLAASFLRSAGFDAVHIDGVCAECERIASAEGVAH